MSRNRRTIEASPSQVWDVLADGWLYPLWVVGASRMREVDGHWPTPGARLHHSVGVWPLLLDDTTEVLECAPRSRLVVRARAWPSGEAQVSLDLSAAGGGTEVVMEERAVKGPGAAVPGFVQDPMLHHRNVESLRRLAYVVEHRARD